MKQISRIVMTRAKFHYPDLWDYARDDVRQVAALVALETTNPEEETKLARLRLAELAKDLGLTN